MSIDIVRTLAKEEWRQFVEQHPAGNIFHTPQMFEVFGRARGHRPELWAAVQGGRTLALLLPVQVTLKEGLLRYFTTRSIVYGGVFCPPCPDSQKSLALLLHSYLRETHIPLFTELRHQTDSSAIQPVLQSSGFGFEEHSNYLVDLALPADQLWNHISKSARKHIRQVSERGDLTIEELQDREKLPVWYALIRKTYARARVPLADFSLFEAAFDILYPKGMIQFLLGRVHRRYIAASVALLYKGTIYGWYRGFNREYSSYLPNDLMVWHVMQWGAENGYRVFDFGGAGNPNKDYGPRSFKAKFGGTLVNYGRNICVHAPLRLMFSRVGYQILRKLL